VARGVMPAAVLVVDDWRAALRPDARPRGGVRAGTRDALRERGCRLRACVGERVEADRRAPPTSAGKRLA
jgi:hypothetical protein